MSDFGNKKKYTLWLSPETMRLAKRYKVDQGLKTQSMFIEKAVRFYCGYITSETRGMYLPEVLEELFDVYVGGLEDKICNMLYKNSVELAMLLHVYCALNDVTEDNLKEVHDAVMKEIKSTYGIVSFKKILEYQNSQK